MKITLESDIINLPAHTVFSYFSEKLFKALNPWFMPMKVEIFEGCLPGNRVIVSLGVKFISAQWISEITSFEKNENEIFFIDIGKKLPFPLKKWEHKHQIVSIAHNQYKIIDEITYQSYYKFLDKILKPLMLLQFGYRKKFIPSFSIVKFINPNTTLRISNA